jgi:hypothetical protein
MDSVQKARLIQKHWDINVDNNWWWDSVQCSFIERMGAIGIDVDEVYFSGFYSQGDGACFVGRVYDWDLFLRHMGVTNEAVILLARKWWSVSCHHTSHYYHSYSVHFNHDTPYNDGSDEEQFVYQHADFCMPESDLPLDDIRIVAWLAVLSTFNFTSIKEDIEKCFRGHMEDLYKELRSEHEDLTTDDAIWDTIVSNELDIEEEETYNNALNALNAVQQGVEHA